MVLILQMRRRHYTNPSCLFGDRTWHGRACRRQLLRRRWHRLLQGLQSSRRRHRHVPSWNRVGDCRRCHRRCADRVVAVVRGVKLPQIARRLDAESAGDGGRAVRVGRRKPLELHRLRERRVRGNGGHRRCHGRQPCRRPHPRRHRRDVCGQRRRLLKALHGLALHRGALHWHRHLHLLYRALQVRGLLRDDGHPSHGLVRRGHGSRLRDGLRPRDTGLLADLLFPNQVDRARVLGRAGLAPPLLVICGHPVGRLLVFALLAALAHDVLRTLVLLRAAVAPPGLALVRHAEVRPLLLAVLAALVDDVDGALVLPRARATPSTQPVVRQPEVRALHLAVHAADRQLCPWEVTARHANRRHRLSLSLVLASTPRTTDRSASRTDLHSPRRAAGLKTVCPVPRADRRCERNRLPPNAFLDPVSRSPHDHVSPSSSTTRRAVRTARAASVRHSYSHHRHQQQHQQ